MDGTTGATWLTARQIAATESLRRVGRRLPEGLPLAAPLIRSQLGGMFGAPDLGWDTDADSIGLVGVGSATRRLLAEPASIAGGVRSLMVQAAHPLAMAGVAEHSRFRDAPLQRLAGTSAWVTVSAFGTVEATLAQAQRVRAMHGRVRGTWRGRPYRADDPRLLIWVSVALTSSLVATNRLFAPRPLGREALDAFVAEQALAAALLDPRLDLGRIAPRDLPDLDVGSLPLVDDGLPTDLDGLAATLTSFRGSLEVTAVARDAVRFLYDVDVPPLVRPVYARFLDGVAATLPDWLRDPLEAGTTEPTSDLVALGRILVAMRVTTGRSPAHRRALAAARTATTDPLTTDARRPGSAALTRS